MPTITNKRYRQFLDSGEIEYINNSHIEKALGNIKHKNIREARALLICLYYTGARPVEVLELMGKSVWREKNDVKIKLAGKKHGLPRTLIIPISRRWMKELYEYSNTVFDNVPLFSHFIGKYSRKYYTKKGEIRETEEITGKIKYYFKNWFSFMGENAPNVYFLRHNRFSMFSEKGATMADIKFLKGARTIKSVEPYTHLSTERAKKIKRMF